MSFIQPDDHMLIMNLNQYLRNKHGVCRALTSDDLARLRDVGARTVVQYAMWSALAAHGWGYLDTAVSLARKHGLRCLIDTYNSAPAGLPKEWYAWNQDNTVSVAKSGLLTLSLWNQEAHAALLRHINEIIDRYPGGDVAVVFTGRSSGETVLAGNWFYDPVARLSHIEEVGGGPDPRSTETLDWVHRAVVAYYTKMNGALLHHHNQILNTMSPPALESNPYGGLGAQEDLLATEYRLWPNADRYLMQYTYWRNVKDDYKGTLDRWRNEYDLQLIVEADHCVGLPTTAPQAIAAGFRGQLVAPVHPCAQTVKLEQAHVDAIRTAIKLWNGEVPIG